MDYRFKVASLSSLVYFVPVVFFSINVVSQDICHVSLEAENGVGGEVVPRSSASGKYTARLVQGKNVTFQLQYYDVTGTGCYLELISVTYSNDGTGEDVKVSLNGSSLGYFKTITHSNYGHYWNIFVTEKDFSSKSRIRLNNGPSILSILPIKTDTHGVEIDKLSLQLECLQELPSKCPEVIFTVEEVEAKDEEDSGLSEGAIVGIFFGIVTTLMGIPTFIFAMKKFCSDS